MRECFPRAASYTSRSPKKISDKIADSSGVALVSGRVQAFESEPIFSFFYFQMPFRNQRYNRRRKSPLAAPVLVEVCLRDAGEYLLADNSESFRMFVFASTER